MPRSVNANLASPPRGRKVPGSSYVPSTEPLRSGRRSATILQMRRSRQLKPLSSEHHHALLVAFQLKQALAGHPESAGAPKDLVGLAGLVRRFAVQVLSTHTRTEEDVLGSYLAPVDLERLRAEHLQLARLVEATAARTPAEQRAALAAFAELLERHVRWEERELFPYAEGHVDADTLADIGGELERRLVLARTETRPRGTTRPS